MDQANVIAAIFNLLLSGGLLGIWLRYRIQNRKLTLEEREDEAERKKSALDRALDVVTGQRDDALHLVEDCRSRLEKMEMEVQGLRFARDLDPFPNWIIGLDGSYLFANREFEKQFLEPVGRDYRSIVGETHEVLWPASFCKVLRNLDAAARRIPDGHVRATTVVVLGGDERQVTVHKFPIRVRGAIVAFAGYFTDIQAPEQALI